jgi:PAS domain S-box-containing protein
MEKTTKILFLGPKEDEHRRLRDLLQERSSRNFDLSHVPDLMAGYEILSQDKFDLILLSVSGGAEDGVARLEALHLRFPNVPIIALGDADDENFAVQTMRKGAEEYLIATQIAGPLLRRSIRYAIERHRAEEKLVASEAFYHSLVENLPQNIFRKNLDEQFTFANKNFCSVVGQPLESIIGKTDFDFFPAPLAEKYQRDDRHVIQTGRIFETVEENVSPAGDKRYVNVVKTPIYDAKGNIIGIQGIFWDITERKQWEERLQKANAELARSEAALRKSHEDLKAAQAQLIQAEKMESIGTLAAGVAHEVKNPLAILMMGINYLGKKLGDDDALATILRDMKEAIYRADSIARGLLEFSSSHQLNVSPADLNSLIEETLRLVRHTFTEQRITLVKDLKADLPQVQVDKNQLQQVFVNIIMNAIHAMPEGGQITVRTYARQLTETTHFEGSRKGDRIWVGDRVVIAEFEDTGSGIPEEHLSKVFDPFFTTKPTGVGTGLGLPVSKRIIDLHGGTFELRNKTESRGVRATITLKGHITGRRRKEFHEPAQAQPRGDRKLRGPCRELGRRCSRSRQTIQTRPDSVGHHYAPPARRQCGRAYQGNSRIAGYAHCVFDRGRAPAPGRGE